MKFSALVAQFAARQSNRSKTWDAPSCDIEVLDLNKPGISDRAKALGIKSLPAVVVDGKPADCCSNRGIDESVLKAAGIGSAIG